MGSGWWVESAALAWLALAARSGTVAVVVWLVGSGCLSRLEARGSAGPAAGSSAL